MKAQSVAAPVWGNDRQPPFLCIYKEIIKTLLGNGGRGLPQCFIFQSTKSKIPCQSTFRNNHLFFTPVQNDLDSCLQLLPAAAHPSRHPGHGGRRPSHASSAKSSRVGALPASQAHSITQRAGTPLKKRGSASPSTTYSLDRGWGPLSRLPKKSPRSPQREDNSPLALQKTQAASKKKAF